VVGTGGQLLDDQPAGIDVSPPSIVTSAPLM
jgi:hypothetical protein